MTAPRRVRAAFWSTRTIALVVVSIVVIAVGSTLDGVDRLVACGLGVAGLATSVGIAVLWKRDRL